MPQSTFNQNCTHNCEIERKNVSPVDHQTQHNQNQQPESCSRREDAAFRRMKRNQMSHSCVQSKLSKCGC